MTIYKLIAGYIIKQMQENCWVTSLSFSLLNLFQTFLFNECSWFVTKKKWSKYRPKYFESWYRSRESTLILAAMVWRESRRESIRWFASKSRPCPRWVLIGTWVTKYIHIAYILSSIWLCISLKMAKHHPFFGSIFAKKIETNWNKMIYLSALLLDTAILNKIQA